MSEVIDKGCTKHYLITGLKYLKVICSMAAPACPILGVASSLIQVVLDIEDNEDIDKLKQTFDSVNKSLNEISQKHKELLEQIKKSALDHQFCHVEENLRNQFRKFNEIEDDNSKNEFVQSYIHDNEDQNLYTLYQSVMGESQKLFSQPILEVYMSHSKNNRHTMEYLCNRLNYLFCIGLMSYMGYCEIINENMEALTTEWTNKMMKVQEKMKEELEKCNA